MPSHLSIIANYSVKRQEEQNFRSKFREEISCEEVESYLMLTLISRWIFFLLAV
jgi:hypothetical protein